MRLKRNRLGIIDIGIKVKGERLASYPQNPVLNTEIWADIQRPWTDMPSFMWSYLNAPKTPYA